MAGGGRPRAVWARTGLGGLAAAGVLAAWDPTTRGLEVCLFKRALVLPCPSCGLTRATSHLLHGDLPASLALHPLAGLLAAQALIAWLLWGVSVFGRSDARPPITPGVVATWALANAALLLAVWIGRLAVGDLAL